MQWENISPHHASYTLLLRFAKQRDFWLNGSFCSDVSSLTKWPTFFSPSPVTEPQKVVFSLWWPVLHFHARISKHVFLSWRKRWLWQQASMEIQVPAPSLNTNEWKLYVPLRLPQWRNKEGLVTGASLGRWAQRCFYCPKNHKSEHAEPTLRSSLPGF